MIEDHINGKMIKEALVSLLRKKYGESYKYYSRQNAEGILLPAFIVDVRLLQRKDETINIVSKEYSCRIIYFQSDPSARDADEDQYNKESELAEILMLDDPKRNPKGAMILQVADRYLDINEFGVDFIGSKNNILEVSFIINFYDFKDKLNEEELIEDVNLNKKLEE